MVKKEFEGMSKAGYRVNHMNATPPRHPNILYLVIYIVPNWK